MKEKLNTILKKFYIYGYSEVRFDIKCGENKISSYELSNNIPIKFEFVKKTTIPMSFTMIVNHMENFETKVSEKIDAHFLTDIMKHIDPEKFNNIISITVTGWDGNKIIFNPDCIISLRCRESSIYEAIQVNDELAMYHEILYETPNIVLNKCMAVKSYFPTMTITTVTVNNSMVFVFKHHHDYVSKAYVETLENFIKEI